MHHVVQFGGGALLRSLQSRSHTRARPDLGKCEGEELGIDVFVTCNFSEFHTLNMS